MGEVACVYFADMAKTMSVALNHETRLILHTLSCTDGVWMCTRRSDHEELRKHVVSDKKKTENSLWPEPTEDEPDMEQLNEWGFDGVVEATDGCRVEPDGVCNHGYPSWFIHLGVI